MGQECEKEVKENNNLRKREGTVNDDEDEVDKLWDSMEVIQTESRKHKKKSKQVRHYLSY